MTLAVLKDTLLLITSSTHNTTFNGFGSFRSAELNNYEHRTQGG